MKRPTKPTLLTQLFTLLAVLAISAGASAATMDVLTAGYDLRLEYPGGAFVIISFKRNGTYTTNSGSRGTWTLNGDELCTVRRSDGVAGCGTLPLNKSPGDVWTSTDANDIQVTASIVQR